MMYKLTVLAILFSLCSYGQTQDSIPSIETNNPKKKTALVFSLYKPLFNQNSQYGRWFYPYDVATDIPNEKLVYQNYIQRKMTFDTKFGIALTYMGKKRLNKNALYLNYGCGFFAYGFSFTSSSTKSDSILIGKKIITQEYQPSQYEYIRYEDERQVNDFFFNRIGYSNPTRTLVAGINIPLALEFYALRKTAVGINLDFYVPVYTLASGYIYDPFFKKYFNYNNEASFVSRLIIMGGLHIKQEMNDNYFLEGFFNAGEIFSFNTSITDSSPLQNHSIPIMYNVGLKVGKYL